MTLLEKPASQNALPRTKKELIREYLWNNPSTYNEVIRAVELNPDKKCGLKRIGDIKYSVWYVPGGNQLALARKKLKHVRIEKGRVSIARALESRVREYPQNRFDLVYATFWDMHQKWTAIQRSDVISKLEYLLETGVLRQTHIPAPKPAGSYGFLVYAAGQETAVAKEILSNIGAIQIYLRAKSLPKDIADAVYSVLEERSQKQG